MTDSWYKNAIRAKWDVPEVREAILDMIDAINMDGEGYEASVDIEDAVFGPRLACPHGCGSTNLPGAPECWGCEEKL